MPNFVKDLFQYMGISLNIPKNLNFLKGSNGRKPRRKKNHRRSFNGNGIDLEPNKKNCVVSSPIIIEGERSVKLWGQVKDCYGHSVENVMVKLLKPVSQDGNIEYVGVAQTTTDSLGFYEFYLSRDNENTKLIVIASKASSGNGRTIDENSFLYNP